MSGARTLVAFHGGRTHTIFERSMGVDACFACSQSRRIRRPLPLGRSTGACSATHAGEAAKQHTNRAPRPLGFAFLPSRRPISRTVRRIPHRPTDFFGPRVREVRDRPTDPPLGPQVSKIIRGTGTGSHRTPTKNKARAHAEARLSPPRRLAHEKAGCPARLAGSAAPARDHEAQAHLARRTRIFTSNGDELNLFIVNLLTCNSLCAECGTDRPTLEVRSAQSAAPTDRPRAGSARDRSATR